MTPESFLKSIGSSLFWRSLDKFVAFIKHVVIAATIGLSAQLDVFYMATGLLGLFVFSWGRLFEVIAVPDMVKAWKVNRNMEFRQIAAGLFSLSLLISLLLAIILYLARTNVTEIAIGFDKDRKYLFAEAMPWLLPAIMFYIPMCSMSMALRALRNFSSVYKSEFIAGLSIFLCVFFFREDEHVLFWSFSAGVVASFLFLLYFARQYVFPLCNPFSFVVRQSLRLAPGLLSVHGLYYAFILTDRIFVSFLPTGEVSALAYGMMLPGLLLGLLTLGSSLITVIAEQKSRVQRAERINDLISMVIYIGLGWSAFIFMTGQTLIRILLERGAFSAGDTENVVRALSAYAWATIPMLLMDSMDRACQVEQKIGLIVRRFLLGLLANIVLTAWFLFGLEWGSYGVALATSISYWIMLLTSLSGLEILGYDIERRRHLKWSGWNILMLVLACYGFFVLKPLLASDFFTLFVSVLLFGGAMLLAGLSYCGHERNLLYSVIRRCLLRR